MSDDAKPLFVSYCAKDFLDGVHTLTALEELAYRRICDLLYSQGGKLVDEATTLRLSTKTEDDWPAIRQALIDKGKIRILRGCIYVKRVRQELDRATASRAQKIKASKKGVESRKKSRQKSLETQSEKPRQNSGLGDPVSPPVNRPVDRMVNLTSELGNSKQLRDQPPDSSSEPRATVLSADCQAEVWRMLTEVDQRWQMRDFSTVRMWVASGCDPSQHIIPVIADEIAKGAASRAKGLRFFTSAIERRRDASPVMNGPDPAAGSDRAAATELAAALSDDEFAVSLAVVFANDGAEAADDLGRDYLERHGGKAAQKA